MAVQMLLLLHKLAADKVAMVTALNLAQRNAIIGDKFASRAGQIGNLQLKMATGQHALL